MELAVDFWVPWGVCGGSGRAEQFTAFDSGGLSSKNLGQRYDIYLSEWRSASDLATIWGNELAHSGPQLGLDAGRMPVFSKHSRLAVCMRAHTPTEHWCSTHTETRTCTDRAGCIDLVFTHCQCTVKPQVSTCEIEFFFTIISAVKSVLFYTV